MVNDKRIQRLLRQEGLKAPYRKRKKPYRGIVTAVGAMCPIAPDALWAMAFPVRHHCRGSHRQAAQHRRRVHPGVPGLVVDRSIDAGRSETSYSMDGSSIASWKPKVLIEDWRIDYNEHRRHSAHGELTPSEFLKAWTTRYQPVLA